MRGPIVVTCCKMVNMIVFTSDGYMRITESKTHTQYLAHSKCSININIIKCKYILCTVYRMKEEMVNSNGRKTEKIWRLITRVFITQTGTQSLQDIQRELRHRGKTGLLCAGLKQKFKTTLCSPPPNIHFQRRNANTNQLSSIMFIK